MYSVLGLTWYHAYLAVIDVDNTVMTYSGTYGHDPAFPAQGWGGLLAIGEPYGFGSYEWGKGTVPFPYEGPQVVYSNPGEPAQRYNELLVGFVAEFNALNLQYGSLNRNSNTFTREALARLAQLGVEMQPPMFWVPGWDRPHADIPRPWRDVPLSTGLVIV